MKREGTIQGMDDTYERTIARFSLLTSALVSDALDGAGWRDQVLGSGLHLLDPSRPVAGFAFPMQAEPTDVLAEKPYAKQFEAVERLQPGEVLVVSTGGSDSAFWGELFSTRVTQKGVRGAVVDGLARDRRRIREMGFPLAVRDYRPTDSYGRLEVYDYGKPLEVRGVLVRPGDFILADEDGVVVVPSALIEPTLAAAEAKMEAEARVREELRRGARVDDVYRKFGVM